MSKFSTFFKSALDSKDICVVCKCNFKLITMNKYTCSSCSQIVCKEHSYEVIGEEVTRICEICRDRKILEENEAKNQEQKEKLFSELRNLDEDRQKKTSEISKIGARIRKVVKLGQDNQTKYNLEEEELRQEVEKLKKQFEEVEKELNEVKSNYEVQQISEGKAEIKLKRVNQNLEALKIEVDALQSENNDQKSTLEELVKGARIKVPIRVVKETICKMCLMKVSLTHAVMFKNVLPIAEEKRPVSIHDDLKRKTCSCNIS